MEDFKILEVFNINRYQVILFMYKFKKKLLPPNFDNFFNTNLSLRYNLRTNLKDYYRLPKNSCKYSEHSITYQGPKLWNDLCEEIKKSSSLKSKYF